MNETDAKLSEGTAAKRRLQWKRARFIIACFIVVLTILGVCVGLIVVASISGKVSSDYLLKLIVLAISVITATVAGFLTFEQRVRQKEAAQKVEQAQERAYSAAVTLDWNANRRAQ